MTASSSLGLHSSTRIIAPEGAQAAVQARVRTQRPSESLVPYVDHFWFSMHPSAPTTTLLPDGRVDVVLARTSAGATVSVYGSVTSRTDIALESGATYIGVQLRPGCARHFVNVLAHELTDLALPGRDVLRPSLDRALDAATPLAAIAALDAALLRHLACVQPSTARIDQLVGRLEAARGNLRITDLADGCGISERQIERAFLDAVGLSPKAFACILRFNHAAAQLRAGCPIAEAALAAGYADQSHLHQAFRRYTCLTPACYAQGDVGFFQDGKRLVDQDDRFSR